jgi:hypothetical protein
MRHLIAFGIHSLKRLSSLRAAERKRKHEYTEAEMTHAWSNSFKLWVYPILINLGE